MSGWDEIRSRPRPHKNGTMRAHRPPGRITSQQAPPVRPKEMRDAASQLLAAHDVYACQDCGKCSSACPLALIGKPFSPRGVANAVISGTIDAPAVVRDTWSCLTCGTCYDRCPSAVTFPEFIRDLRELQGTSECRNHQAHDGFFQSLMRTMTSPALPIQHWQWLPDDVHTDPQSKLLFFGGCAPYFDAFFRHHLGTQTTDILVDSLRLLNFFRHSSPHSSRRALLRSRSALVGRPAAISSSWPR